jgi:hypothetical protein
MNQDSAYNPCPTRTPTVLLSNSTLLGTDTTLSGDVSILLMTTPSPTGSLAPIIAIPPMRKTHTPALPADTHRQIALLHIASTETVARQSRNTANQPGTVLPHHAIAIPPRDVAPHHHEIAMHRPDHPSHLRKRLVATEQGTLHNPTRQILIP